MPALEPLPGPIQIGSGGVQYIFYNPGTEASRYVKIKLRGSLGPAGLFITNYSTGQICSLACLSPQRTIVIDTKDQTVKYEDNGGYAFSFHKYGYLAMEGCGKVRRDVRVFTLDENSSVIRSVGKFYKGIDHGYHIYLKGKWYRIMAVLNTNEIVIDGTIPEAGEMRATIAQMNQIELLAPTGMDLTQFEIETVPLIQ